MSLKATLLFLFSWLFFIPILTAQTDQIRVNEVFLSNPEAGWFELYNSSREAVHLQDIIIEVATQKIRPDQEFIEPNSYLTVPFELKKEKSETTSSSLTTPSVVLFTSEGNRFQFIPETVVPAGSSVGRLYDDSDAVVIYNEPTPESVNTGEFYKVQLSAPSLSVPPGFYAENISLSLETIHTGATIRYTTDGSTPDENSPVFSQPLTLTNRAGDPNSISMIPTNQFGAGHPYNEEWQPPLGEVKKLNVIRAQAYLDGTEPSEVITASYLIDESAANRFSMPVISVNTDSENFFDPDIGIYVWGNNNNYNQRGSEWERPVHLEFFEDDGSVAFAQQLGARIHGGTSRSRPRKSLRLYARADYGESWINYQFFPDKPIGQFKRLLLRNSGNDWDRALFRDAFMQNLVEGIGLDIQYSRAAVVFLNGEYWGVHNVRDRLDNRYIESHYGLDESQYTVLGNNAEFLDGNEAGVDHYNQLRLFINNNGVSNQSNYEEVKTRMDVDNFIDYQATQIYLRNTDWPGNNLQYWRSFNDYNPDAPYGLDGRWRWMLFDTDFGFNLDFDYVQGHPEGPAHNTLAFAMQSGGNSWPNPDWSTFLLRRLVTNTEFKNNFINRFSDLLNTYFREDVVIAKIDSVKAIYQPEMQEHIDRWRRPVTIDSWQENLNSMSDFANQRPSFMRQFINQQFGLSGNVDLTINVNDAEMGIVQINRTRIEPETPGVGQNAYPWSGIYFKNIPIEFTAIPKTGYRFVQWQGASNSTEESITQTFSGNATLTAVFEPDEEEIGEIAAWDLSLEPYSFSEWASSSPAESYPQSMMFYQTDTLDPRLSDETPDPWILPYDLSNRSRITGLGVDGVSFINTANPQEEGGGYLGSAVLALNTSGQSDIQVSWRGGTIEPNSRVYHVRLQYRIGAESTFEDVLLPNEEPVEYKRNEVPGHTEIIGPVTLPASVNDRDYVELRWKYYYTGTRLDDDSGQRTMIRLDDILVTTGDSDEAEGLAFDALFPTAQTGYTTPPFFVRALTDDGITDVNFNAEVTLSLESGPGEMEGTLSVSAQSGEALFDDIEFTEPGEYVIRASSESIESILSATVQVTRLTEILMPKYIQGEQPDNNDRIPFAYRIKIEGLNPSAVYRYYNRVIDQDDAWDSDGAGNAVFVNEEGGEFIRTTNSPRFQGSDFGSRHYDFLTDADGTYEGWFITEPSGNSRFSPENIVHMRILLNDGNNGEEFNHYIDTFSDVRVIRFGNIPGQSTGFIGSSSAIPKNFIALYEDEAGEDRPVSITFVENAGFSADERYADYYLNIVNGESGLWGTLLPNDLPNGIRRIEERSLLDGFQSGFISSSDGTWENGISTVNPNGGLENPIIIDFGNDVPIENTDELPSEFTLSQNYPNPFNPSTQISYGIPEAVHVRLEVYSINGQLVTVLQNGVQSAGYHTVTFDTRSANMASGVYLYRLEAGEYVQVKKMLLVK